MKRFHYLAFALLLSAFLAGPLLRPGIISGHDQTMRDHYRLQQLVTGFQAGRIYPRWQTDFYFGYGYPFFNFYQPLFYVICSIPALLGVGITTSLKIGIIFSILTAAGAMFLCARQQWGDAGGLLAAVIYTYSPYHMADLLVRSSLSEFFVFVFFPLCFWALQRLWKTQKGVAGLGLASAGLMLSHNVEALFFMPFLAVSTLVVWLDTRKTMLLLKTGLALGVGAGLSMFFWLPALMEKQYVNIQRMTDAGYNVFIHFLVASQLFFQYWGGSASGPGVEQFPFGILFTGFIILVSWIVLSGYSGVNFHDPWALSACGYFIFLILMMLEASSPVWKIIPFIQIAQFPWRLMAPASFAIAFIAPGFVKNLKPDFNLALIALILILPSIAFQGRYCHANTYLTPDKHLFSKAAVQSNGVTTTASNEYLPRWVKEKSIKPQRNRFIWLSGRGVIQNLEEDYENLTFSVVCDQPSRLELKTLYFPGWKALCDSDSNVSGVSPDGLLTVDIPTGMHEIRVTFTSTPVRLFSQVISLMVLLGVIVAVIRSYLRVFEK